jgi:hypothetical protein
LTCNNAPRAVLPRSRLEVAFDTKPILDMYRAILTKGLIVMRVELQDMQGMELIDEIARRWSDFYGNKTPRLQSYAG